MQPRRGRPILGRMSADIFIFIALQAAAVLGMVVVAWTLFHFGAPGPPVDR